ncbi:MAG: DNA-binding transcriptional regulator OxyR [Xanthomonadales bacterium]|nr:DNA-binding transcriptional regulator OxyR [Xanthomonadales bacterium]
MNIRALKYLVALADIRHFGRAADACFVSQPTLSTQIKKLEEELGVQLVERMPRKVMLTEVGEEIVDRARLVLRDVEQIREVARRTRDPEAGVLRIGIFPTLGPYLLPHVVPEIHRTYPRLELLLFEEKTEILLTMLREGRLDAAILAMPIDDDGLEVRPLFEEPFIVAMPNGHPLEEESALDLDSLRGHTVLLLEDGHCMRDQALEICQTASANEKPGFRATSLETLRQMVAANVGVTLLPTLAVQPPVAVTDSIRLRRFADPMPVRKIGMVWRKSSAVGGFLEDFARLFTNLPDQLLSPPN